MSQPMTDATLQQTATDRRRGWSRYLRGLLAVLVGASLLLPLAPAAGEAAFGLLIYGQTSYPAEFTPEAASCIRLTNAVLGAVMAGWFATMLVLLPLVDQPRVWRALVTGLAVWYLPDTAYSLASGYWQNAVLNTAAAVLITPPLVALRPGTT